MIKAGDYGPRPIPREDEVPTNPLASPAPRARTPIGGFLAPLGQAQRDPFPIDEAPTPTVSTARVLTANKHFRLFAQLSAEDAQLVHAFAVRLLAGAGR